MPAVSVIIPVYNGAAQLPVTLASVTAQRFRDLEVIVVDDGSTDASAELAEQSGARVVRQSNRGPAAARNAACAIASGRYLAFLDADDHWMPEKLAASVAALEEKTDAVLAFSNALLNDASGAATGEAYVGPREAHAPSMAELLTRWWPIVPSTAVVRREAFDRSGGFDEEFRAAAYEDPWLWLRIREQGEFVYIAEPLVYYRAQSALSRIEKYLPAQKRFLHKLEERYGAAVRELMRTTRGAYATALSHEGLLALRAGERVRARRLFARALREDPVNRRYALRWLRTLMPLRIAQALSGGAGRITAPEHRG